MNSDVIHLAIGLKKIKELIERQKERQKLESNERQNQSFESVLKHKIQTNDLRVFNDLNIKLSLDLSQKFNQSNDEKKNIKSNKECNERAKQQFQRKVAVIGKQEVAVSGLPVPKWTTPLNFFAVDGLKSDIKAIKRVDTRIRREPKRFVSVLATSDVKSPPKERKIKPKIVNKENEKSKSCVNSYDRNEIKEYIKRQKELRKLTDKSPNDRSVKRREKSYDVMAVREYMRDKRKARDNIATKERGIARIGLQSSPVKKRTSSGEGERRESLIKGLRDERMTRNVLRSNEKQKRPVSGSGEGESTGTLTKALLDVSVQTSDLKIDLQSNEENNNELTKKSESEGQGDRSDWRPKSIEQNGFNTLDKYMNGFGDDLKEKEWTSDSLIVAKTGVKMNDDFDCNESNMSSISCLTESVATNAELSPLSLSPNSSISLRSQDFNPKRNVLSIESSVKQIVDKVFKEVPDWDTLVERVYNTSFKDKNRPNSEPSLALDSIPSRVSPNSPKAMEVFPPALKTKSALNLLTPKPTEPKRSHSVSPPLNLSDSLQLLQLNHSLSTSSSSSSTTTPSTTKSMPSEVAVEMPETGDNISAASVSSKSSTIASTLSSYNLSFESNSDSSMSLSLRSNLSPKDSTVSVRERVGQIIKGLNLSDPTGADSRSPKVSAQDLFRLTSDMEEFGANDDDTDNVSSIKSDEELSVKSIVSEQNTFETPEIMAELDIQALIGDYCRQLYINPSNINSCEYMAEKRSPFRLFLFDLVKEIISNDFLIHNSKAPELSLKVPLRLQKKPWPKSVEQLTVIVSQKAMYLLNKNENKTDIRKDGLMGFIRRNKRRDLVDTRLYEEMCLEDQRWTNFDPEIEVIKEKITDLIMDQMIAESVDEWKRLNNI